MQRSITSVATAALCTGWMIFAAQPAAAQAQAPAQQPPASQAPPTAQEPSTRMSPSSQQLDKTAAAIKSLRDIRSDYAQKLATAKPEEQDKLATEANAAMKKAVTNQGLSVEEYNSIIRLAENDPSVRAQIQQRLGAAEK